MQFNIVCLKALVEGLLKPEEIRRIRKKLGLTQTEAGQMIGGGPRAFQKYESGDLLPSRAISSALTLLDHDPKALTLLKKQKKSAFHIGDVGAQSSEKRNRGTIK